MRIVVVVKNMLYEIEIAVQYLIAKFIPEENEHVNKFNELMTSLMLNRYQDHWYTEEPLRGSGYRSLEFRIDQLDQMFLEAIKDCDVPFEYIRKSLADNFIIFVDPGKVQVKVENSGIYDAELIKKTEMSINTVNFNAFRNSYKNPLLAILPSYGDYDNIPLKPLQPSISISRKSPEATNQYIYPSQFERQIQYPRMYNMPIQSANQSYYNSALSDVLVVY